MSLLIEPDAPTVLVAAVGAAEGARGAAAALACAGADADRAALLVDLDGRAPRPTLLASTAARQLEERLAAHLPRARVAARGQVCHLAAPADEEGLAASAAAVTVARGSVAVVNAPAPALRALLEAPIGRRASGVLLRADLACDRALVALVVGDLIERGLAVAVVKQRLGWVDERRALFGALGPQAGALPRHALHQLLSHACYGDTHGPPDNPEGAAQPERRDHAGIGQR